MSIFLNRFLDCLIKISPLILAILTGYYVWYTKNLVKFTKKPKVYLNIGFNHGFAMLVIENSGQTAAKNFNLEAKIVSEKKYNKHPSLKKLEENGINCIPPQTKLSILIASIKKTELFKTEVSLKGKINYTDEDKNKYEEEFDLFLNFYLNQGT
jgi:hypothetical protein